MDLKCIKRSYVGYKLIYSRLEYLLQYSNYRHWILLPKRFIIPRFIFASMNYLQHNRLHESDPRLFSPLLQNIYLFEEEN